MKKRFALIVAGGLVAVLIASSAALSLGMLGASSAAGSDRTDPRVQTIHRTVTIHRQAKPHPVIIAAGSGGGALVAGGDPESESEDGSSGESGEAEVLDE